MHIDPSERKWIYVVLALSAIFLTVIVYTAVVYNAAPPSNVETIDSAQLHLSEEFAEDRLGARAMADGSVRVTMVAARYGFFPRNVTVPAATPVTFRWATLDVLHGVHAEGTNMATMIVPGFVSQLRTVFPKPGVYQVICNEFCGVGHDYMWSQLTVVPKADWKG